jgi:2-phospho-L-lactate guanylyltransferase
MIIWAIVPVKPFPKAKSRLAPVLAPDQRQALAEKFFRHTLEVLTTVKEISGVMVVSRDTKALAIAREYRVHTLQESGAPELNAALTRASQLVGLQGADGVLILPADLPLLVADDVREIVRLGRFHNRVVLAPDRQEEGTNALLLNPPTLMPFSYGPGSYLRHKERAERAGAAVKVYHSNRIALDIDTPDDLELYQTLVPNVIPIVVQPPASSAV